MKKIAFIFLVMAISKVLAEGAPSADLSARLCARLADLDQVLRQVPDLAGTMDLQDINIDFTENTMIGLSGVLSLNILPEVDFVLTPVNSQKHQTH